MTEVRSRETEVSNNTVKQLHDLTPKQINNKH